MAATMEGGLQKIDPGANDMEKPHHYTYLKEFRTKQCPEFLLHKCTQHRPFTCFNWHFNNQKRRRPIKRRDGTFNYSSDNYCAKYDETAGNCPDGDDCPLLHRTAGDTERRYHLRYYKTCPCVYETDSKGHCVKNGLHCAFAHGPQDLRKPVFDIREVQAAESGETQGIAESPLTNSLESDRILNENPVWCDPLFVLANYKTELCNRPLRLCRQGYACPSYHNPRDKRRSPVHFKYRSTPCPNVKVGDEWSDPSKCETGDMCGYCHTRTEQQFHLEIYKSTKCNDMVQTGYCPRGLFCAFAHVEQEMNVKWDISLANNRAALAALSKGTLPINIGGSMKDESETDGPFASAQPCGSLQFDVDKANIVSTPRKHSLIEFGDLNRRDEFGNDGFGGEFKNISSQNAAWLLESVGKGRIGSSLSSSLNDSFLSSMQPPLGSTGPEADVGYSPFRSSTMSFGSYQQYQQQQQNRANKQFQYPGFSTASPTSRYFPSTGPSASANQLPPAAFLAAQQQLLQPSVQQVLPSPFFTRGNMVESALGRGDDDLDLNLSDLNSALDQEFLKESDKNRLTQSFNNGLTTLNAHESASLLPALVPNLPMQANESLLTLQPPTVGSPLSNFCTSGFVPHPSQPTAQLSNLQADHISQETCEAWKKAAEKQERLLKQMEEERDMAVKIRDSALSKVAELKHEIDMLSGGAPVLHCLQQDVDFQQMPLSTLQQLRATLQHDYNILEQKLAGLGLCCVCKERPSVIVLYPCNHCILCYFCANKITECPACGTFITQKSSLPSRFA